MEAIPETVLVVDDASLMRKMLSDILEKAGLSVIAEAGNGAEAVALAAEHAPDVVTMDVMMPIKNGIEAAREIIAEKPSTQVIMVSSVGEKSLIDEAMEAGAADYIVKPFRENDVIATIQRVLSKE